MAPIRGQNKSSAGHLASYQMNAIEGRPIPGTLGEPGPTRLQHVGPNVAIACLNVDLRRNARL